MNQKKLYLLRHAQAENSFGEPDNMRKLSSQGRVQSRTVAAMMREKGWVPDKILVSSAVRTRMTVDHGEWGDHIEKVIEPSFYNAETEILLDSIRTQNSRFNSLLLVAHNPGIHQLAINLAMDDERTTYYHNLMIGYPPCTLSVLSCPVEEWGDLMPDENHLQNLIKPD